MSDTSALSFALASLIFTSSLMGAGCDPDDEAQLPRPTSLAPGAALAEDIVLLARDVVATDRPVELTTEVLTQALMATGFGVRLTEDFVYFDDVRSQGIVFEPWDIETMATALHAGVDITVQDYADAWVTPVDGNVDEFRIAFLNDLATAAASENAPQQAFAQFVIAIGREREPSVDLLDPEAAALAPLNAVQMGLLTYRLAVDLVGVPTTTGASSSAVSQGLGNLPCTQSSTEALVADAQASATSLVFGFGIDAISGAVEKVGTVGDVMGLANAALAYIKLAWTMAVFRVDMHMDNAPLVRTITRNPGTERNVVAKFALDGTGKAQIVNCMRTTFNLMNLDFTLPEDGPLAGKIAEWTIVARGKNDVIQSRSGDLMRQETNEAGESTLVIVGKPQTEDLTNRDTIAVDRHATILATTNIKHKDMVQDLVDASAGIGGLGAFLTMPVETLNRIPLLFTGKLPITILDHKVVEGALFHVRGDYSQLFDSGSKAKDIHDGFEVALEVKVIPDGETTIEILQWVDETTTFTDDYVAFGPGGEGCDVSRTPLGTFEVFTVTPKIHQLTASYTPDIPEYDIVENVNVIVYVDGFASDRGFDEEATEPSCPGADTASSAEVVPMVFSFNSTQFGLPPSETVIDERDDNGEGWKFTITYVRG